MDPDVVEEDSYFSSAVDGRCEGIDELTTDRVVIEDISAKPDAFSGLSNRG
jgi:hypothetical protein